MWCQQTLLPFYENQSCFSENSNRFKSQKYNEMFSSSTYDRFGGRGRGRGRPRDGYSQRSAAAPRSPSPPSGPILTTIRYSELEADQASSSDARITGLEDVATYNWLKADEPTIMTPG
jgi:hypothetical protein